jgi:hypothetical protein
MKKKIKYIGIGLFALLIIGYCNSDEYQNSKNKRTSKEQSKPIVDNNSESTTFDANGNELSQSNNKRLNLNDIIWSSYFSNSDISGEWFQIIWYEPMNESDKTYYIDGDKEQIILTLTSNIYQTSTIAGGENPEFKYKIVNDRLIVTTKSKLASEIFNYQVLISEDKKILKLSGKYEVKVYNRK